MVNTGEALVQHYLKQYMKKHKEIKSTVYHNTILVHTVLNGKALNEEYDHILVWEKGIVVYETKHWRGTTVLTKDMGVFAELLPFHPFDWNDTVSAQKVKWYICNLKPEAKEDDAINSQLHSYSADDGRPILKTLRGKSMRLMRYVEYPEALGICNRLVFIEKEGATLKIDGDLENINFGRYTKVLKSIHLENDLDQHLSQIIHKNGTSVALKENYMLSVHNILKKRCRIWDSNYLTE